MAASKIANYIVASAVEDAIFLLLTCVITDAGWYWATMKSLILLSALCLSHCDSALISQDVVNNRPIIGVLAQEQSAYLQTKYPENYTSYIAASYVKAVEAAGARVVPIMIGKTRTYYENLMSKLNGVLLPGGSTYFNQSNGYADAGQHIYELATSLNEAGDYFAILGTCLGMELLVILASGRGEKENRVTCHSFDNRRLHFEKDFRDSKMFKGVSDDVVTILENNDVTYNAHSFCILDDNLKSHNLTDWRVTSHSEDARGMQFIASMEHTKYPFYGVQFHPEKSAFEWKAAKNYPSGKMAVLANRHFLDFFVDECRKSQHVFASAAEENEYVIYNFQPYFTGVLGSAYHQCYFFEPRGHVREKDSEVKKFGLVMKNLMMTRR